MTATACLRCRTSRTKVASSLMIRAGISVSRLSDAYPVPKSSMARSTPSSVAAWNTTAATSGSCSASVSVISRHTRRAEIPVVLVACMRSPITSLASSCRGETLM